MISKAKFLIQKGFFHIFGVNVINSLISFATNIVIVRFLFKGDYGIFSNSYNAYSIFMLFSGIGMISGLLQYCSEKRPEEERQSYYKFSLLVGLIFNALLCVGMILYALLGKFNISETPQYIIELAFLPFFEYTFQFFGTVFRIRRENKRYSLLMNINTICYFIFACGGARLGGIRGTILGRYIAFAISIVLGLYMCREMLPNVFHAAKLQKLQIKGFLKYSSTCCASTSISQLLYLLDVFMIGTFFVAATVASYKTATLIPNALSLIPASIMVFIYPYFAAHNTDFNWIKNNSMKLFKGLACVNALISIILYFGAPLIIRILWGENYMDSVRPFQILSISYFFLATFRVPAGNILAMLRKVKINLIVSIISGIANVVFCIVFIRAWGSNGAALATLFVVILSSLIAFPYLIHYIKKNIKLEDLKQENLK